MKYLEVFIDGFDYFSLFPYIIYGHLKCVSRLRATLYNGTGFCSPRSLGSDKTASILANGLFAVIHQCSMLLVEKCRLYR